MNRCVGFLIVFLLFAVVCFAQITVPLTTFKPSPKRAYSIIRSGTPITNFYIAAEMDTLQAISYSVRVIDTLSTGGQGSGRAIIRERVSSTDKGTTAYTRIDTIPRATQIWLPEATIGNIRKSSFALIFSDTTKPGDDFEVGLEEVSSVGTVYNDSLRVNK